MRKIVPILIFLDNDLEKSARSLTNHFLDIEIKYACQVLFCSIYYMLGFRNKKIFKYYFNKDRWDETRFKYFSNYPEKSIPKFTFYNTEESRWCRKCTDHYNYVWKYMYCMLDEYYFRFGKDHKLTEMCSFLKKLPMTLAIKHGLRLTHLKNKSKFQLPWKNLPLEFRRKDIIKGYQAYYTSIIFNPVNAYIGTKREIPEFLHAKADSML